MTERGPQPPRGSRSGPVIAALAALLAAAIVVFYFWSLHCVSRLSLREKQPDYYNLQVHGWRKGSLAMDVAPHPDLRVEYPNRITRAAPFLLDACYYEGKYYLYFGPTPGLLLLLPYQLLTGFDFPEALAAAVFASLGFLLAAAWTSCLIRAFFPEARAWARLVALLALGLANLAPAMLVRPLFYELAIASAYAFTQAALFAATLAVLRPAHAGRWLALASLCAGLAAGSRPNSIVGAALALPLLTVGAWWQGPRTLRRGLALLAAAGLPAALCGAALLWHNHARFGRFLEFGLNLQLGANPEGFGFALRHFWHNLQLYYLTPPLLDWYFPFVSPGPEPARPAGYYGIEEIHGQFVLLPAIGLAAAIGLLRVFRTDGDRRPLLIVAAVAAGTAANFALVAASGVRTTRYMLDFQPGLLVLLAVALFAGSTDPRRLVRGLAALAAASLLATAVFNIFVSFQIGGALRIRDPEAYAVLEQAFNRLAAPLQRRLGPAPGPQRWRVDFPASVTHREEPLLVAGAPWAYDGLYLQYGEPGRARLVFEHTPHGSIAGPEFSYPPGGSAELTFSLGTLFPPVGHPWYGSLPEETQLRLRRTISARLDGQTVLDTGAIGYAATVRQAGIGRRWVATRGGEKFSGRITPLPPPAFVPPSAPAAGSHEIYEVIFPDAMIGQREPLVTYGPAQVTTIDTVFVEYLASDRLRFGYDSAGLVAYSPALLYNPRQPHRLEVDYQAASADGARPGRIRINFDREQVWSAPLWSRQSPGAAATPLASPGGRLLFTGTVLQRETNAPPPDAEREIPLPPASPFLDGQPVTTPQVLATWLRPDGAQATIALHYREPETGVITWRQGDASFESTVPVLASYPIALSIQPRPGGFTLRREEATLAEVATDFFTQPGAVLWIGHALRAGEMPTDSFGGTLHPRWRHRPATALATPTEGPLALNLRFPAGATGKSEPLVIVGETGRADGVFVRYVDERHVAFGYDHWGVPATVSEPVAVDYAREHSLWIDFDSLRASPAGRTGRVRVRLDGREVWDAPGASHGYADPGPVLGENRPGMSTSGPRFTGTILQAERRP